jgi:hypothetical protein
MVLDDVILILYRPIQQGMAYIKLCKLCKYSLEYSVASVTTGPLERSNCRVHLRGRCRDLLTDAVLTPG